MLIRCKIENKRKCKNVVYMCGLCLNHINLLYYKYIIKIQKIYKGIRCRKYVKRLKEMLPRDIQLKIINKINEDYYYLKYLKRLKGIIYSYVDNIHNYINISNESISIEELNKGYFLYNKYIEIIDKKYLKHLFYIGYYIIKYIDNYMNGFLIIAINLIYNFPILSKINIKDISYESANNLKINILKYNMLYYNKFYKKIN